MENLKLEETLGKLKLKLEALSKGTMFFKRWHIPLALSSSYPRLPHISQQWVVMLIKSSTPYREISMGPLGHQI